MEKSFRIGHDEPAFIPKAMTEADRDVMRKEMGRISRWHQDELQHATDVIQSPVRVHSDYDLSLVGETCVRVTHGDNSSVLVPLMRDYQLRAMKEQVHGVALLDDWPWGSSVSLDYHSVNSKWRADKPQEFCPKAQDRKQLKRRRKAQKVARKKCR